MICRGCESDTFVIDDHTTGDSVCTNCGTIVEASCIYKDTYEDSTRTSVVSNSILVKRITKICEKYSISTKHSLVENCEEWLHNNHKLITKTSTEFISYYKIRVGVCITYLCHSYDRYSLSITKIREWSSRLSVKEDVVIFFLKKLRVFNANDKPKEQKEEALSKISSEKSTTDHEGSFRQEWFSSLQKKCFDILTDIFRVISIERKNAVNIKKECSHIIHQKAKFSIIGIEYLAACIVKHIFQKELQDLDDILVSYLRLNKHKFLSTYKTLYK